MRFLVRRSRYNVLESDLELIENVMSSGYFILIDLFFWSLLLTLMTLSLHSSLTGAIFIFICSYFSGVSLYYLLRKWLGD